MANELLSLVLVKLGPVHDLACITIQPAQSATEAFVV